MRQEVEFRLKRDVARAPKARAGRASPVARRRRSVDVRRSSGPVLNAKPLNVLDYECSKLGAKISPYIKSEVPPADHGLEVAIAAPSPANAPIELGEWMLRTTGRMAASGASLRKRSPSCERMRHCE